VLEDERSEGGKMVYWIGNIENWYPQIEAMLKALYGW